MGASLSELQNDVRTKHTQHNRKKDQPMSDAEDDQTQEAYEDCIENVTG